MPPTKRPAEKSHVQLVHATRYLTMRHAPTDLIDRTRLLQVLMRKTGGPTSLEGMIIQAWDEGLKLLESKHPMIARMRGK